ncbi:MAG TPA: non-canonical purine NTP pyrophosphatase, RdgB/HAM1 family [Rhizobiales bacterium]|jgi:XTP/dITP diphosphohydrolase|nr:non-canonical purine NTP pyrophosphatase, RdgB/HAM1 family [Hyphomicrobiales bacterium]HAN62924.1 non-canonical purine NTP pyrophosphatase, RdgB/HAM1 family [Hyphomicrobiales bacterium]HBH41311.1 non-canonical purine NTP pyrophosphatase, RdgB/HAM1 family [Hyphomicrobiales bacterium]HCL62448.1 non-canonical purine NTP pyrophosphatase, RdgB/HAM1 family [Hyphomicrobiales bacterium]
MMGDLKRGDRIVIATHNEGKASELAELFAPLGIETVSAGALGLKEPEETGESFAENAEVKAEAAAAASGMLAVADDSGLEVASLGGAPGIHSARWGGPNKDFRLAMERVNRELEASGATDRRANFTCALAFAQPAGKTLVFTGKVDGTLVWPPRGTRGFGYDPIFVPDGYTETFGEMDPALKNEMSHRMRAFEKLILSNLALR